jgi:hypothetical protein
MKHHALSRGELPESGPWQQRIRVVANSARKPMLRIDGIADVLQTQPAKGAARQVDALMLMMIFILGSVSFEQALDGLPHQLTESPESRFKQGLDVLIAGLCAM